MTPDERAQAERAAAAATTEEILERSEHMADTFEQLLIESEKLLARLRRRDG